MSDYLDGAKLHDLGDGERVEVSAAGVPVTVLRAFELTTQRRTQRRRFEFRTTDAGALTLTAFEASPALTVGELLELDWSALSLKAFALASAPAAIDRRRSAVERRDASLAALSGSVEALEESTVRPGRKSKVDRSPAMLQRVLELHEEQGIEAVSREFGVSTRTAYNYLTTAQAEKDAPADTSTTREAADR